ncbi:transposase [Chitinophaga sp. G-6-1-13]|uniref:Transposase n=1 Tax=Chitinophaga fulva TaxID=2728842 RepID=A0A848GTA6_9BACT|nr:helix-turn-helix domain-containing protein [Chitinophaga fulva]NML39870.1 transposase [Chitinophaga fulva]
MQIITKGAPKKLGREYSHDLSFIRQVVSAYLTGTEGYVRTARRFNVSKKQVEQWVSKFSSDLGPQTISPPMTEQEQQDLEFLKKQKEELERQLAEANRKIFGLQTLIDVAEESLQIDIRKKSGPKQSKK